MKFKQILLLIVGFIIVIFLLLFVWRMVSGFFQLAKREQGSAKGEKISSDVPESKVSESNMAIDLPVAYGDDSTPGYVEGALSYPDGEVPEGMKICAEDVITDFIQCTEEHIEDSKYSTGLGYRLELPAGKYFVYALDEEKKRRGYYSEIECVENCSDALSEVIVPSGETVTGIDPVDWRAIPQE